MNTSCSMENTTCSNNEDWRIDFQKYCIDFQVSVLAKLVSTKEMLANRLDWPVNIVVTPEYIVDLRCMMVTFANKSEKKEMLVNI